MLFSISSGAIAATGSGVTPSRPGTSHIALHIASGLGRATLTGLALAHGYDTAFWWIAGIFAAGAVIGGSLLRSGPVYRKDSPAQPDAGVMRRRQAPPSPHNAAALLRYAPGARPDTGAFTTRPESFTHSLLKLSNQIRVCYFPRMLKLLRLK